MFKRISLLFIFMFSATTASFAADMATVKPHEAGFTKEGLKQLKAHFQSYVDDGKLAGLTTLIARKGKLVQFETYGQQNAATSTPTADDTVFRIYSMTKPITGVAMMMLWEEGKFKLDDPISKYLPSFKNQQVFESVDAAGVVTTSPVKREATIRDLMRHTAGLSYGYFSNTPVDLAYRSSGMFNPTNDLEHLVAILGKQPLLYQPGEKWVYSLSVDVQGRLIEVLSGKTLAEFFDARIFKPLGMTETSFTVSDGQKSRLTEIYGDNLQPYRGGFYRDFTAKPPFLSGGGGLVSTTIDYWRFAQMVANGGSLDGVQLLKTDTVAMMSTDQLPDGLRQKDGGPLGLGFGFDFAVVLDVAKNGGAGRVGEYYWNGLANTLFWIDPEEDIVAILMTNYLGNARLPLRNDMRKYVYGALESE